MIATSGRRWIAILGAAVVGLVVSAQAQACATDTGEAARNAQFIHPAPGRLASTFGPRLHPLLNVTRQHNGVDYVANIGDPIHAAAGGEVVSADHKGESGIAIEIRHGGGWETIYAHLSRLSVRAGDCVKAGDVIGMSGNTGFSTGPKLHFEIRRDGKPIDPASLLDIEGRN